MPRTGDDVPPIVKPRNWSHIPRRLFPPVVRDVGCSALTRVPRSFLCCAVSAWASGLASCIPRTRTWDPDSSQSAPSPARGRLFPLRGARSGEYSALRDGPVGAAGRVTTGPSHSSVAHTSTAALRGGAGPITNAGCCGRCWASVRSLLIPPDPLSMPLPPSPPLISPLLAPVAPSASPSKLSCRNMPVFFFTPRTSSGPPSSWCYLVT